MMLKGLRIVEICGKGPAPFSSMHLADLGADVIVVERDESAATPPDLINRGKRSVTADLKTPQGRELVLQLIEHADAIVEGMRPGVMERLGLGPDACHARNPRLVYGRMTGWGQTGPLAQAAGHDNNYIALSGALYHNGMPAEPPATAVGLVGDVGGGLYLTIGLLAGIMNARMTGKGTVVDAAIVDASAHMMQLILSARSRGLVSDVRGDSMNDGSHFFGTYRCSDGHFITLASLEPQFYALMLKTLGLEGDPLFAQQWNRSNWQQARARLAEIFASRSRAEWQQLLEGTDVCFGPVLSLPEAAAHPHMSAREVYFEAQGVLQTAAAPRFDGRAGRTGAIPARGEHNLSVRRALSQTGPRAVWQA